MKIRVQYMAHLKQAAGTATAEVELERSCTVAALLHHLATRHGDALRRLLFDANGAPQPTVLVFVNDQQVDGKEVLQEGDEVSLLSPIAGGLNK